MEKINSLLVRNVPISLFITTLICLIGAGSASGIDYFVSPGGLDSNAGTIDAPFKTITKARDAVRTINNNMAEDITVFLRDGWYIQSSTLKFDQSDSGTNGHNIIYQAYSNEHPVISGGTRITGWTLHDASKNIWKASAPGLNTRQLYVDCVRAIRAHKGSGLLGAVKTDSGYTTTDTDISNWGNQSDIEFVYNGLEGGTGGALWTEKRVGVSIIVGTKITMKQPAWYNANNCGDPEKITVPTDIENAYELLDKPGEWHFDRSQGMVYYIPRAGENLNHVKVIAPILETLVSGNGLLGTPIHNLQFKGITFAHATWLKPSTDEGFPEVQANSRYNTYSFPGGNIVFKIAQSLRFERCIFKHLGGEGLELSNGCQNCVVIGCVFTDISGNCIRIGDASDPARGDTRARDSGNQVTNCYIHDSPCEYHGGVGVFAGYVSEILLSHNEISNTPYTGISCGWGWGRFSSYAQNNQFQYNHIHNFCQVLSDAGGIYTLSAQPNTTLSNNWFDNMPWKIIGAAIYPDEGSAYLEIYNNVCSAIGNKWLYIWTPTIHDINVHDNFTNTENVLNNGTNTTVKGINLISGVKENWPQAAQDIANNSGIEGFYIDMKTAQCGCLITGSSRNGLVLTSSGNKSVNVGSLLQFTITATDWNLGGTLIYSAANLPSGSTFDSACGVFSWIPTNSQLGSYLVTFSVSDGKGGTDSETITITVVDNRNADVPITYPNPFKPNSGHNNIIFSNLGNTKTKISIFSFSGRLIKEIEQDPFEGKITWNIKDKDSQKVPSGVYLYSVKNSEGKKSSGKIAVIK
jgi:hypothetical protein